MNLLEIHFVHKVPVILTCTGSIFCMFVLIYASKWVHAGSSLLLLRKYDNVQASYRSSRTSPGDWRSNAVARAFSAHQNTIEAFAIYSVAMLLALQAQGHSDELEILGNAFILIRIIYIGVYLLAYNEALGIVRSSVWATGILIILRIFFIAADTKPFLK